jgi:hypothetical protein
VRFVDAEVQPGRTYQYSIQVRMAQPRLEPQAPTPPAKSPPAPRKPRKSQPAPRKAHKSKPAAPPSARPLPAPQGEIVSEPVETGPVTVPPDVQFFAVDQKLAPRLPGASTAGIDSKPAGKDRVALQVHRWVADVAGPEGKRLCVADWLIAERLLVAPGEWIGQPFAVDIPHWDVTSGTYVLPAKARGKASTTKGKRPEVGPKTKAKGPEVDFGSGSLLVAFEGGKAQSPDGKSTSAADETAVQLLVLSPDGRLLLFHRHDEAERERRYQHWRDWQQRLRTETDRPYGGASNPFKN